MAEATKTRANSPNGRAAQQDQSVAERVTQLRRKAKTDAEGGSRGGVAVDRRSRTAGRR